MYCTNAIKQSATIRVGEYPLRVISRVEPKQKLSVQLVKKVAQAITAELKRIVIGFLQKRREEQSASSAASRMAASPPYRSIVRKMNVSETVICDVSRGILTIRHGPSTIAISASMMKCRSVGPGDEVVKS